jgi:xanthine dehydrogenase large subunit
MCHQAGRSAEYIDDMIEPVGHDACLSGLSTRAHAEIVVDGFRRCAAAPGVIGMLTAEDIPGENDVSPSHKHDEPIFAMGKVQFWGQPLFAVIAETRDAGAAGGDSSPRSNTAICLDVTMCARRRLRAASW